jgi:hypothetical protein
MKSKYQLKKITKIVVILFRVAIHTYGQPIYGLGEFPEWALQEASATCLNVTSSTLEALPSPMAS